MLFENPEYVILLENEGDMNTLIYALENHDILFSCDTIDCGDESFFYEITTDMKERKIIDKILCNLQIHPMEYKISY